MSHRTFEQTRDRAVKLGHSLYRHSGKYDLYLCDRDVNRVIVFETLCAVNEYLTALAAERQSFAEPQISSATETAPADETETERQ